MLCSSGIAGDKEEQGQLRSGREVLDMLKERMTIRIFDPLGEHHHEGLRRLGEGVVETDKLELKDDYETPAPLGLDLFRQCGQLTDYQWTLLSGGDDWDSEDFLKREKDCLRINKLHYIQSINCTEASFDYDASVASCKLHDSEAVMSIYIQFAFTSTTNNEQSSLADQYLLVEMKTLNLSFSEITNLHIL